MDSYPVTTVEYHNQHPVIDAKRGISGSHLPADSGKTGGQTAEQDLQTGKYHGILAKTSRCHLIKTNCCFISEKPQKANKQVLGRYPKTGKRQRLTCPHLVHT